MRRFIILGFVLASSPSFADVKKLEKGGTYDCAKSPAISIGNGMGTYTFKGKCTRSVVDGAMNKIAIESVDALDVSGAETTISITALGSLGADNTITWKKAIKGDKPAIKGDAAQNKITQAK